MSQELIRTPTIDISQADGTVIQQIGNIVRMTGISVPLSAPLYIANSLLKAADRESKRILLKQEVKCRQFREFLRITSKVKLDATMAHGVHAKFLTNAHSMMLLIAQMDDPKYQAYFMDGVVAQYHKDPDVAVALLSELADRFTGGAFEAMRTFDWDKGLGPHS